MDKLVSQIGTLIIGKARVWKGFIWGLECSGWRGQWVWEVGAEGGVNILINLLFIYLFFSYELS